MRNIDAILMEKIENSAFIKEQLETNFSDEKISSYIKSYVQVRGEDIIYRKISKSINSILEKLIGDEVEKFMPTLNLDKIVSSRARIVFRKDMIEDTVDEIIEDDFYDSVRDELSTFFKNTLVDKLCIK